MLLGDLDITGNFTSLLLCRFTIFLLCLFLQICGKTIGRNGATDPENVAQKVRMKFILLYFVFYWRISSSFLWMHFLLKRNILVICWWFILICAENNIFTSYCCALPGQWRISKIILSLAWLLHICVSASALITLTKK